MSLDTREHIFNRANVAGLYALMSDDLGIPRPNLTWTERSRNGRYCTGEIVIGPRCWRRWYVALHEFAHHVHFHLAPFERGSHGPLFREALEMVAHMALGDAALYAWANEYKSIGRWWVKGGRDVRGR